MKKLYYPNCSELIADFNTHDVDHFYDMITGLIERNGWEAEPKITKELLTAMKSSHEDEYGDDYFDLEITLTDRKGNHTSIQYGDNGYEDSLGFRLDSGCNHGDGSQYNFFHKAIQECQAQIRAYDGGSTSYFEEWNPNDY